MSSPREAFPGVNGAARPQRDQVINAPGQRQAFAHIKAAAEARYNREQQAAQAERDKKCLLNALGDREGERGYR